MYITPHIQKIGLSSGQAPWTFGPARVKFLIWYREFRVNEVSRLWCLYYISWGGSLFRYNRWISVSDLGTDWAYPRLSCKRYIVGEMSGHHRYGSFMVNMKGYVKGISPSLECSKIFSIHQPHLPWYHTQHHHIRQRIQLWKDPFARVAITMGFPSLTYLSQGWWLLLPKIAS